MKRTTRLLVGAILVALGLPAAAWPSIGELTTTSALDDDWPGGDEAFGHVETYAQLPGLPRTGTRGSAVRARWIAGQLHDAGLEVSTERFTFPQFTPHRAGLEVGDLAPAVEPFYYSGITPPTGVSGELVDVGLGTPPEIAQADLEGNIALIEVPSVQNAATPTFGPARDAAEDAGAVAAVTAIHGPANHIVAQNSDARAGLCEFPTLVVGRQDGEALRERDGQPAKLTLHASYREGTAQNVIGVIPGRTDDVVLVGTPYNGWYTSAAERGTGLGVFLALAEHFAQADEPPEQTMIFVVVGGHEIGFLGLDHFLRSRPELLDRLTAYVHVGATVAARNYVEVGGEIIETGLPEPLRVTFSSENPVMIALAERAMRRPGGPPFSMAPSVQNPGEQRLLYAEGIPVVAVAGGHLFFHTPGDTPETTSAALLDPMVAGFGELLDSLVATDRETLRTANLAAEHLAEDRGDDDNPLMQSC